MTNDIRVKALEWKKSRLPGEENILCAESPFGVYRAHVYNSFCRASLDYRTIADFAAFPTLEEAKAACQADFARRVGECVEEGAGQLRDELYQLKLLICGGEDAPGYANTLTVAEAEEMLSEERQDRRDAQSALESTENLVREIDVILYGEEGSAPQAVLCDLVCPIKALKARCDKLEAALSECVDAIEAMQSVGVLKGLNMDKARKALRSVVEGGK